MSTIKRRRTKVEMMDRISGLTDTLLLHVLSFLQTKDAVATSLLSKRWRPLWRFLRKLDFDDTSFRSLEFFHQFVDAALHLVHLDSVQSFVLKCVLFSVSPVKVNIWVNALISYKLTYLDLHFSKGYIRLSSGVFNCNSICVLKLRGLIVGNLSTVNLPSLKVLHLKMVRFSNSVCAKKLLSKCVHVEELVLKLLDIPDVDSTLNIPRFKHLLSAHVPASLLPVEVFSNVQFLILCEDKWYPPDDIPTFHNLIHLEIHSFAWIIVNFLQNFPKLQSLVILNCGYDSEGKLLMEPTPHHVPPCVSYHLKKFALIGFIGSKREFEIVRSIMENARVLKTVIVGSAVTCERKGFQMLIKLSSYRRRSPNCRLFYHVSGIGEGMRKFLTFSSVSMYLQGL